MHTNEIHWHDSRLQRVIELPEEGTLLLDLDYPVDWENNKYEPHRVTFSDVHTYEIHEGPITGALTLLSAEEQPAENETRVIRLETTAGYRLIRCRRIGLHLLNENISRNLISAPPMAKNKRQKRREQNEAPRVIFALTDIERSEFLEALALFEGMTNELTREIEHLMEEHPRPTHVCFEVHERLGETSASLSICLPADPDLGPESRSGIRYSWTREKGSWVGDDMVMEFGG